MLKLSRLLPKEITQLKFETQQKYYSSILGVISQSFSWKCPLSFDMCWIFQEHPIFAIFTIEIIGNETWPLLNFVNLSSKAINTNET